MKEKIKALFVDLVLPIFYRVERVEYIRFAPRSLLWIEYLILYYKRRLPLFVPRIQEVVNSSIEFGGGRFFETNVQTLRRKGVQIESRELSLEEFSEIAKYHPLLRKDPWVREHLPRILKIIR